MMSDLPALLEKTRDKIERRLLLAAWLTECLKPRGVVPVVVGGTALEFYTTGGYTTSDLDLVCPAHGLIGEILEEAGFQREGRHWIRPAWELYVEVPGAALPGDPQRIEEVEIAGMTAHLISREELLIDRLNALVHWKAEGERIWLRDLIALHGADLDWGYIVMRAQEEQIADALVELRREMNR